MPIPVITGEAIVVGDEGATLRHTQNGQPVSNARLKFSDRRRNDDGTWSDAAAFYVDATAWGPLAERLAEAGSGGAVLKVSGRLDTQEWEDRESGRKRSKPRLTLDMLEPKPRRDQPQPSAQSGGFGGPAGQGWGSQPSGGGWGGTGGQGGWDTPQSEEIPF